MRTLLSILVLAATAGCGTAVYNHKIEVSLNDPARRLGDGPIEVSIFDHVMGYSDEWARRTIGTASAGRPYSGAVAATATKMVYDSAPPDSVEAGLAIPALQPGGYFVLQIKPTGGEQTATLPYKSYRVPTADEDQIKPLTARFTSAAASEGWTIQLVVDIPPDAPLKP